MYAVREEVEVLKEQIKELVERNSLLERENALLKSLSNNDRSQLQGSYDFGQGLNWAEFIFSFIEASNNKTNHTVSL